MKTRLLLLPLFLFFTALTALPACKQGEGQRCQLDSDCSGDLVCTIPAGGSRQEGGTCQQPGGTDAGNTQPDMAKPRDMSPSTDAAGDAATDGAMPEDGATPADAAAPADAATPADAAAAPTDAALEDAATTDAATNDAAV